MAGQCTRYVGPVAALEGVLACLGGRDLRDNGEYNGAACTDAVRAAADELQKPDGRVLVVMLEEPGDAARALRSLADRLRAIAKSEAREGREPAGWERAADLFDGGIESFNQGMADPYDGE